ncbi:hypothetical protein RMN57_21835 [Kitasatospora sp. CM 4170]|uniref:Lipoprotein n=1 Tax=Kitasatospora aburaviensis TaxID=67265 RepID=A0ABW1F8V2_9ACTN|nr:hypothetical protein [Kitasatospora sp. CM 4170]WNM47152.1 hypothetical protein RMN57_21835 [Kitasatospora sp. CM 4170]
MTDEQRDGRRPGRPLHQLRSAAGAVVLAAALAGLAGCSGGATGSAGSADRKTGAPDQLSADPLTAVRSAADITGRTGSAHAATELVTESAEKKAVFTGTGGYDYVKRIGRLEVAVPPGAATTGNIVEVVLPGTVYLQNSGAKVPEGKWVKLDVRQLPDGNLVSSGATDPASAAGALRGAQKAELVGPETVGGVPLKHYRGTLDLAKAAEATGGRGGDGLRMGAQTFTVRDVPYDVWLDEQGRLHKVVEVYTFAGVPGSKEAKDQVKVTSTTSLADFGKPVEAAEPAAADIYAMKPTESPK